MPAVFLSGQALNGRRLYFCLVVLHQWQRAWTLIGQYKLKVSIPLALRRFQPPAGSISPARLLPLPTDNGWVIQQSFLENFASLLHHYLSSQGHVLLPALDLLEILIKVSWSQSNNLSCQSCSILAYLEISQILSFLTDFSRTSLLNPSPVSTITNSATSEIPASTILFEGT